MKKKLDSKIVEYLKVNGPKRVDVWDTVLQGFGVRVSPAGRKVWFVAVRTGGRTRRVTIGTYPAQMLHEAREQARKIIRDAQLGVFEDNKISALTLGETVPLFIQLYAKPKNRTWKESQQHLTKFKAYFSKALNDIRRSDIVRVLDAIAADGTPYSANRALDAIKKLMNWALDRGMIETNPISGLKKPHKEVARERVLSDEELAALLAAADAEGYPFGDFIKLLVLTGRRRNEVSGMRWSEIDLILARVIHGKEGQGRLRFFSLAQRASWRSIYEEDGKLYKLTIEIESSCLQTVNVSEPEQVNSKTHTGTIVELAPLKDTFDWLTSEEARWHRELSYRCGGPLF